MRWIAALLCLLAAPAAAETWTVKLRAGVGYDGDTLWILVPELPGPLRRMSVRVLGVDTPEIRGKCEAEKRKAADARAFVLRVFQGAATVTLDVIGWDKYGGRVDAHVLTPDGRDLATLLIERGLGRPYDGGRRAGWCD